MTHISSAQEIIDRLKEATNATSDSELARLIGVSQQAVSSARKGKVPEAWPRIALSRFGISADWLYTGIGSMLFSGSPDTGPRSAGKHVAEARSTNVDRLLAERDKRIRKLEQELEEARRAERQALLEANTALKRLVQPLGLDTVGGQE